MVDITQYWIMSAVVAKMFVTPDGQTFWESQINTPTQNPLGITLTETSGAYYAQWQLELDPLLGVVEYADQYLWGTDYFKSGQMVRWGTTTMNVGDMLQGVMQIDCNKTYCTTNGWGYYYSELMAMLPTFETPAGTFYNVAKMGSYQSWCIDMTCSSQQHSNAIWYLAQGIGIIGVDVCNPPGSGTCPPTYRLAVLKK